MHVIMRYRQKKMFALIITATTIEISLKLMRVIKRKYGKINLLSIWVYFTHRINEGFSNDKTCVFAKNVAEFPAYVSNSIRILILQPSLHNLKLTILMNQYN